MKKAALAWLKLGRSIIPVDPDGKNAIVKWRDYQDRLPTKAEVNEWWDKTPNAKIAIIAGHKGLAVLDVDDKSLADKLEKQLMQFCPLVRTPSGGLHAYFVETDEQSRSGPLVPGMCDVKAKAGYVIAPPSPGYKKINTIKELLAIGNLRAYATDLLVQFGIDVPEEKEMKQLYGNKPITEGARDDTLTSIGGSLRHRGADEEIIKDVLLVINKKRCQPPLSEDDIKKIAHSVARYESKVENNLQPTKGLIVGGDIKRQRIKLYTPTELIAAYEKVGAQESFKLLGQEGYIYRGWTTLLSGYAKSGKTTLLSQFLKDISPVKALYVAEEPPAIWGERIKDTPDLFSHVTFAPALNAPIDEIVGLVQNTEAEVIIVDTIRNLLQIRDENDNSQVVQRLVPLIGTAQKNGKTLILCHHTRKGGGQYAEGAAGAGAFMGIVDVGLEIRRDSYDSDSPRREIHGWGRLHLIEPLTYQLTENGMLKALGSPQSVRKEAVKAQVLELIGPDKITTKEVWDCMGEGRPSQEQVRRALVELSDEGVIVRDDSSKTHYFYRSNASPTVSPTNSNESESLDVNTEPPKKSHLQRKVPYVVGDCKDVMKSTPISNEPPTTPNDDMSNAQKDEVKRKAGIALKVLNL